MTRELETARANDLSHIESMLVKAGLPTEGVAPLIETFRVVRHEDGRVAAAAVIEWHGDDGLIRSVVVDESRRGQGLGRLLIEDLLASTDADLYLLTESATDFFRHLGFESIDRTLAPELLRQSEEFRCLCGNPQPSCGVR